MTKKIGIFPASGGLGGSIVKHILKQVPASNLIFILRHPDKLAEVSAAGATVRKADYDDPASLERAFDGVGPLMLISYASFEYEHREKVHKRAIDAARRSGVEHIFYSSLGFGKGLSKDTVAWVMKAHVATEAYLEQIAKENKNKFTYTSIREGLYSESFPIYTAWFDPKNPADEITIPHDGSGPGVAWVKRDELGEATAKLIVQFAKNPEAFPYLNKTILLSGPRVYTLAETVEILGRIVGKPLKIREISVDEYTSLPQIGTRHTYHGVNLSREWTTAWEGIRRGETAVVDPLLQQILGREPEDFETTVKNLVASN
ncbi:hypothetical protein Plec18167_003180 [Paecilomyces lecythidis]|uniref:NmrA-like domain-containing protein n=1 Tax=Paecilomyces lecythidis TaxID=3004212 RepID=A0ABR3XZY1_9EURO